MATRRIWWLVAAGIVAFGQLALLGGSCGGEKCRFVDGVEVCCGSDQAMDSEGRCVPRK